MAPSRSTQNREDDAPATSSDSSMCSSSSHDENENHHDNHFPESADDNVTRHENNERRRRSLQQDHERRFALDSVERDAGRVWGTLPEAHRLDKDFVLAALRSSTLPPKSEFERLFPSEVETGAPAYSLARSGFLE